MTNKLAKAIVSALTHIVGPVAVCQRGIVGVHLSGGKSGGIQRRCIGATALPCADAAGA